MDEDQEGIIQDIINAENAPVDGQIDDEDENEQLTRGLIEGTCERNFIPNIKEKHADQKQTIDNHIMNTPERGE